MEPLLAQPYGLHDLFEGLVHHEVGEISPVFICKYQIPGILPVLPRQQPHLCLLALLFFQQVYHGRRHCDHAAAAAFGWCQDIFAADLLCFLKLLVDIQRIVLKVHTIPCQP